MIRVGIHKDISEYRKTIVFGLTSRRLVFSAIAVAAGLIAGLVLHFAFHVNWDWAAYVLMLVTVPFWLLGFFEVKGLAFDKWLKLRFETLQASYMPYEDDESFKTLIPDIRFGEVLDAKQRKQVTKKAAKADEYSAAKSLVNTKRTMEKSYGKNQTRK